MSTIWISVGTTRCDQRASLDLRRPEQRGAILSWRGGYEEYVKYFSIDDYFTQSYAR